MTFPSLLAPSWLNKPPSIQLQGQALPAGDLPPLPASRSGRQVRWIAATSEPGFDYKGQWFTVDDKFIMTQIEAYDLLCDEGEYTAPIRREHKPEGLRYGDILGLSQRVDPKGKQQLIAAVEFTSRVNSLIESGEIKYFSPGFSELRDEKGREFPLVMTELSIVSAPHQKGMGQTHVLNSENSEMTAAQILAQLKILLGEDEDSDGILSVGEISKMRSMLSAYEEVLAQGADDEKKPDEDADAEPPPAAGPPAEKTEDKDRGLAEENPLAAQMTEMKAQLAELQKEREDMRVQLEAEAFQRSYPTGAKIELTESQRGAWFKLAQVDEDLFKVLINGAVKKDAPVETLPVVRNFFEGTTFGLSESTSDTAPSAAGTRTQAQLTAEVAKRQLTGSDAEVIVLREWADMNITLVQG